jgi:hypothetical protein
MAYDMITLAGNLNGVPEVYDAILCAASHTTYRHRLVAFQTATGLPPPNQFRRFAHKCDG